MEKYLLICVIITVFCIFQSNSNQVYSSWKIFQGGNNTSSHNAPLSENYNMLAIQRLAALRNLRSRLQNSTLPHDLLKTTSKNLSRNGLPVSKMDNATEKIIPENPMSREILPRTFFKGLDKILSLADPFKKMITSKTGIESLAKMVIPKREVLQKLVEIKEHLEPTMKQYMTEKYNGFLTSLVPYSENVGVPAFVINSMKVPQGLDPRWQIINSIINSENGLEKFIHSVVSGAANNKIPEAVESRSGDETDLISDQEPDATGQPYRKHQQMYLTSFKRRLLKPDGGSYKTTSLAGAVRPPLDYENILDQNGHYSQLSYDIRAPDNGMIEAPYHIGGDEMDMMIMSASGGRGHGHRPVHVQGSDSGLLDPFTILGGLAFLTYLGLMLQNSLNRSQNANRTTSIRYHGNGRSYILESQPRDFRLFPSSSTETGSKKPLHLRNKRASVWKEYDDNAIDKRLIEIFGDITRILKNLEQIQSKTPN